MDKHAYCAECGRYVQLAGEACPAGHRGDSLRDVRSGPLPTEVAQRQAEKSDRARPNEPVALTLVAGTPANADSAERVGRVVGWLVVLVPALALGALMVALSEPEYEGAGMGTMGAWLAALATVVLTLGAALAWGWLRFVRKRR